DQSSSALGEIGQGRGQRSDDEQRRRRKDDRLSDPAIQRVGWSDPFALDQLARFNCRLLSLRKPRKKEPRVEPSRSKRRSHPTSGWSHARPVDPQAVLVEKVREGCLIF